MSTKEPIVDVLNQPNPTRADLRAAFFAAVAGDRERLFGDALPETDFKWAVLSYVTNSYAPYALPPQWAESINIEAFKAAIRIARTCLGCALDDTYMRETLAATVDKKADYQVGFRHLPDEMAAYKTTLTTVYKRMLKHAVGVTAEGTLHRVVMDFVADGVWTKTFGHREPLIPSWAVNRAYEILTELTQVPEHKLRAWWVDIYALSNKWRAATKVQLQPELKAVAEIPTVKEITQPTVPMFETPVVRLPQHLIAELSSILEGHPTRRIVYIAITSTLAFVELDNKGGPLSQREYAALRVDLNTGEMLSGIGKTLEDQCKDLRARLAQIWLAGIPPEHIELFKKLQERHLLP